MFSLFPQTAVVAGILNAGISVARAAYSFSNGDYAEGAMHMVGFIPGLGQGKAIASIARSGAKVAMRGAKATMRGVGRLVGAEAPVVVEQYALKAAQSGFYPVVMRGEKNLNFTRITWLNKGEVWKYGVTKHPVGISKTPRYSNSFLDSTGNGLKYEMESSGTRLQALAAEKFQLLSYLFKHKRLPPGNKIRR